MTCSKPCEECAFIKETDANCEPYNALEAALCLLGGIPFYCHHNLDWRNPDADKKKTRHEVRKMDVCSGWKREILKLKATGYFKTHRAIKRAYGEIGPGALEIFASDVGKREKGTARKTLRGVIKAL